MSGAHRLKKKGESQVSLLFRQHMRELGLVLIPEHKFHPVRRWMFDWCSKERKLAIEIEGGIWVQGRHSRGAGMQEDMDKYNEALILGWNVLRFSTQDILNGKARDTVRRYLDAREA